MAVGRQQLLAAGVIKKLVTMRGCNYVPVIIEASPQQ